NGPVQSRTVTRNGAPFGAPFRAPGGRELRGGRGRRTGMNTIRSADRNQGECTGSYHYGMGADPGLFPPDAVVRRVDGESVLLLGGGRALLMQLAHPLVARGVAEHSDFRRDPFGR